MPRIVGIAAVWLLLTIGKALAETGDGTRFVPAQEIKVAYPGQSIVFDISSNDDRGDETARPARTGQAYLSAARAEWRQAQAADEPLLFTPEQMAEAYRYQQRLGMRLHRALNPEDCLYGRTEFGASFQGRRFSAPCKFVQETIRHLREALELGVVKYLFPPDSGRASLGVPNELWQAKYSKLAAEELLPALLRETSLAALYETSGYVDPDLVGNPGAPGLWGTKRNILGFYDGRPIEISAPRLPGTVASQPEGYRWLNGFVFLAHSLGELHLLADGAFITFDLAFEGETSEVQSGSLNVSAASR